MEFNQTTKAIYLQIADHICDNILSAEFQAGERLPSVRDYAAQLEVNANTMMRAYDYLQQRGLIFNRRGIGYFVAEDAPIAILSHRREIFMKNELEYFFRRLNMFGITPGQLSELYSDYTAEGRIPNQENNNENI